MVNKHTAALSLPAAPGYPLGITLEPGGTAVPDGYLEAVGENPTVRAWFSAGLIDIEADLSPEPPAEEPPPVEEPTPKMSRSHSRGR